MRNRKVFYLILIIILSFCFEKVEAQTVIIAEDSAQTRLPSIKAVSMPRRGIKTFNPKLKAPPNSYLEQKFKKYATLSFWEKTNRLGLSVSEVAFVNWNAGGNSSISGILNGKFQRNYKYKYVKWDNTLEVRYGANIQEGQKPRKTDDAIRLSSTFGYRRDTISNWYYSVKANFNTQFYSGFKYPDRETPISRFMAPGYVFLGAGTSYIPSGKKNNLYISPITLKATFVFDDDLANNGAFGVQKAIFDGNGIVLKEGENKFIEFGFLINHKWQTPIAENIEMSHRINLYTDYLASFGNIDIDWELNFNLIVNKHINANIGTHLIYDDDILFDEVKDANGIVVDQGVQRIQFKQLLGVGVAYDF